ncbi:TerB family tellurite resistance protein [Marinoscillum sp. MHG1-6]|uniref:TerB family tellurite resistance protein n=1 Tax=Marinoscillum sp. MHG1-6 TaxID=2959627 RepID=UPI00215722A8|nr:TerB family tellurite resistance protein [Marinoscillum sp. MHG1-6]
MLPIEEQLSILVHLSMADDFLAHEESDLIHDIGKKSGLSTDQIEMIIDNPKPVPNLKNLPPDEKFNYLYTVIQLMKIDRKVHQKEIQFCERLAMALGYRPGVVAELSAYIYSDPTITTNRDYLRTIADSHLLRK